ncbi:MAG: hypothetical protein KatS3mg115_1382 [Candidatus Poribacteria bacterium]|nr:MAG: hypothetical protein KatS3mg115_1382 [Candidatus Poribacteria bacterium]
MGVLSGVGGAVRLAVLLPGEEESPPDRGPAGGPAVGEVTRWEVRLQARTVPLLAMGREYITTLVGFIEWTARIELLWDAEASSSQQRRLLRRLVEDPSDQDPFGDLLEIALYVRDTPGNRAAYYGVATLAEGRLWLNAQEPVRARLDLIGWGPLRYRSGFFAAGSFGVLEGESYQTLEGLSFAQIESREDHS